MPVVSRDTEDNFANFSCLSWQLSESCKRMNECPNRMQFEMPKFEPFRIPLSS